MLGVNGMRRRSRENLGTLASGKGNVQCHSHCPVFCLSPAKAIGPDLRGPAPAWEPCVGQAAGRCGCGRDGVLGPRVRAGGEGVGLRGCHTSSAGLVLTPP